MYAEKRALNGAAQVDMKLNGGGGPSVDGRGRLHGDQRNKHPSIQKAIRWQLFLQNCYLNKLGELVEETDAARSKRERRRAGKPPSCASAPKHALTQLRGSERVPRAQSRCIQRGRHRGVQGTRQHPSPVRDAQCGDRQVWTERNLCWPRTRESAIHALSSASRPRSPVCPFEVCCGKIPYPDSHVFSWKDRVPMHGWESPKKEQAIVASPSPPSYTSDNVGWLRY